jgi:hypothetical protein
MRTYRQPPYAQPYRRAAVIMQLLVDRAHGGVRAASELVGLLDRLIVELLACIGSGIGPLYCAHCREPCGHPAGKNSPNYCPEYIRVGYLVVRRDKKRAKHQPKRTHGSQSAR